MMRERLKSSWILANEATPEELAIALRRYGRDHDKPCNDPSVLTCAMLECQVADRCRRGPPPATDSTGIEQGRET